MIDSTANLYTDISVHPDTGEVQAVIRITQNEQELLVEDVPDAFREALHEANEAQRELREHITELQPKLHSRLSRKRAQAHTSAVQESTANLLLHKMSRTYYDEMLAPYIKKQAETLTDSAAFHQKFQQALATYAASTTVAYALPDRILRAMVAAVALNTYSTQFVPAECDLTGNLELSLCYQAYLRMLREDQYDPKFGLWLDQHCVEYDQVAKLSDVEYKTMRAQVIAMPTHIRKNGVELNPQRQRIHRMCINLIQRRIVKVNSLSTSIMQALSKANDVIAQAERLKKPSWYVLSEHEEELAHQEHTTYNVRTHRLVRSISTLSDMLPTLE